MANGSHPNVLRKRHNLTAWILQILVCLVYLGIGIFDAIRSAGFNRNYYSPPDFIGNIVRLIAIAIATFTIAIVEIVFFAKHSLSPVLLLVLSSVTTALWGLQFIEAVLVGAATASSNSLIIYLPVSGVALGTTISQVVISAKMMRSKQRQTDALLPKYDKA
ncbi:hypothetical protein MN608_11614 [Microdochium nivale]|nr:hypothetical protein MN608_11614 [Microdochium nivale]